MAVLDEMEGNIESRKRQFLQYREKLKDVVTFQVMSTGVSLNYAYVPVLLPSEEQAEKAYLTLKEKGITVRRYFYPSLDTVEYFGAKVECAVSRDVASRILCLPIFYGLDEEIVDEVCSVISDIVD
ncbi:DegT/DnrJ/EryC1/StrS family aminotransferase [Aliidiomarina quisquiliarum]|uniref:DegT/DnrJ/EryC1/StrS family aminotransferase n=1 Tax=Aliidiomarina quisquiliarum TaxID=2938947 RepID=UPI00208E6232|nr:DegT/DnrJ/EryC1/StrS family aminotransferase [Aliidiomarina quisquiliarum]